MRVKCDDCPCLSRSDEGDPMYCNIEGGVQFLKKYAWNPVSKNCPLVEVRYWKDGEMERFTPIELVQNPDKPRER